MQRIAITGAGGRLGRALVDALAAADTHLLEVARPHLDITVAQDRAQIEAWRPDVIVNAAAWTDVDGCSRDPDRAFAVNGHAAGELAAVAARCAARFIQVSTNEVFAGDAEAPYDPGDPVRPRSVYGASKALGEELVTASGASSTIVRTAWLFGPHGQNFVTKILAAAEHAASASTPLRVVDDEWGNPTWIPALAERIRALVNAASPSIVHVAGAPPTSRHGWAVAVLEAAQSQARIVAISSDAFVRASDPPRRAILALVPSESLDWQRATIRYVRGLAAASSSSSDAMRDEERPSKGPTARSSASDRSPR